MIKFKEVKLLRCGRMAAAAALSSPRLRIA
jgi:hypothetical protein